MDLSGIIVAIILVALFVGTVVGLEMYSRKTQPKEAPADNKAGHDLKRNIPP